MGQAAHRFEQLHHLLEWQILVFIRRQRAGLDATQQCLDRRIVRHIHPQRQGVDKKPDQALDLSAHPVRHRRTDHHLILPGQTTQYRRPARQQCHEQGRAVPPTQRLELMAQRRIQHHGHRIARIVLLRRTYTIRGQHQQCRRIEQSGLPVGALLVQYLAAQPASLPHRIVRVLDRQLRQRVCISLATARVERSQLARQHAHRPAIRYDVVHRQQQHMLVIAQPNQTSSNQRSLLKIEAPNGFFVHQSCQLTRAIGMRREIVLAQRAACFLGMDAEHYGLIPGLDKRCAQYFVTRHNPVQRTLQGRLIQRADDAQPRRYVVSSAGTFHLRQKPQPLLSKRQRQLRLS